MREQHPRHAEHIVQQDAAELRREAFLIASYLLHRQPTDVVIERYISGVQILFKAPTDPAEGKIFSIIRNHPAMLQYFDAVSAVFFPKNLLRNKLLLMVAIIETTPEYCDEFFTTPFSKTGFFLEILSTALKSAWHIIIGLLLMLWVRTPSA